MIYQDAQSGVIQSKYNKLIIKNYQDFINDKQLDTEKGPQRNHSMIQNHRSQQFLRKQKTPLRMKESVQEQSKSGIKVKVIGRSQHNQSSYRPSVMNTYHKSITKEQHNNMIGQSMQIHSKSKQLRQIVTNKLTRNPPERFQNSQENNSLFDTQVTYEISGNQFHSKKSSLNNNDVAKSKNFGNQLNANSTMVNHDKLFRKREVNKELLLK